MKKQETKETKEFRVLGRMMAVEFSRETMERARGGKVSKTVLEPEAFDTPP